MERTFLMIKPDAIQRNLIGETISRIERKGLKFVGGKLMQVPMELAEVYYGKHQGKPFYNDSISFITSASVFAMVVGDGDIVNVSRHIIGSTNPSGVSPGSIRSDLGLTASRNITHGSDLLESAECEINLWFNENEIISYAPPRDAWLYE